MGGITRVYKESKRLKVSSSSSSRDRQRKGSKGAKLSVAEAIMMLEAKAKVDRKGRGSRAASSRAVEAETPVPEPSPPRRGRGRPRKQPEPEPATTTTAKRGRGRPRKQPEPEAPTAKRGRGRPRKQLEPEAPTAKRGRGRPRKQPEPEAPTAKRGRGRPRKQPEPEALSAKSSAVPTGMGRGGRCHVAQAEVNGMTVKVGDHVYVDLGTAEIDLREEDDYPCEICGLGSAHTDKVTLECDGCLKGYHMECLDPPLKEIPPGEWLCPQCSEGGAMMEGGDSKLRTAREYFFAKHLGLVKIEGLYYEKKQGADDRGRGKAGQGGGEVMMMSLRWFYLPEDTHTGRQQHHGAREVFRTNHFDENEARCVVKTGVKVCTPSAYSNADAEGDDVFYCEYNYDPAWKRFQRWYKQERHTTAKDDSEEYNLSDLEDSDFEVDNFFDGGQDEGDEDYLVGLRLKKKGQPKWKSEASRGRAKMEQGGMLLSSHSKIGKGIATLGAEEVPSILRKVAKGRRPLERARAALTLSATPKHIPCREDEMQQIEEFVHGCLSGGNKKMSQQQGRCLYISGVPGTGKTATVLEVMKRFKKKAEKQEVPPFQFVELNALRLPTPQHAYSFLLEQLTGWQTTPGRAAEELNAMYFDEDSRDATTSQEARGGQKGQGSKSQSQKPITILLVDEMDQLVTRSQSVLYNIFEWPMHRDSCLSVIGIANTIDLPERFLPRVLSRLGLQRVAFQPYSQQQIQCIIRSRLEDLQGYSGGSLFDKQAVEYVARKVAAVSGDVRRALELCRRGAEIACEQCQSKTTTTAESENAMDEVKVTIKHIDGAIKEMFGASHMKLLEALPELDKIVLGFLTLELRKTGTVETLMESLVTRARRTLSVLPNKDALKDPQIAEIGNSVTQLSRMKLIIAEPAVKHRHRKIALNIPADDITYTIGTKGGEELQWMHKLLKS